MSDPVVETGGVLGVLGVGVLPWGTPIVHADDEGLTRGDGCFEGIRVRAGAVAKLDRHLARMARSASTLGIAFDPGAWEELVGEACAAWRARSDGEAALKLVLTRGRDGLATGFVTVVAASPAYPRHRQEGIAAATLCRGLASDAFADAPWLLGGVKTLSYAVNMAAYREAHRRGADDVIFLSTDGQVLEAPTASVVWSEGRTLCTVAPGANGILPGTTQQLLFDEAAAAGWQTSYGALAAGALADVEGLWLVSSVRGPVEVVTLDGRPRRAAPELTREVQRLAGF
jgi:4-amino-4-deoxychorismate lyase